jgi:hypothetical protein
MSLYKINVEMGNNDAQLNITDNNNKPLGSFKLDSSPGSVDNVVNQIKQINPAGSYTGIQGQPSAPSAPPAPPVKEERSWLGYLSGQPSALPAPPVKEERSWLGYLSASAENAPNVDPFTQPFVTSAGAQEPEQQGLAMQVQPQALPTQAPSAPSAQAQALPTQAPSAQSAQVKAQVKTPAPVARPSAATFLSQYSAAVPVDSRLSIPPPQKGMFSSFWGNNTGGTRRRRAKKTVAQRKKRRKSVRFMGMKYY